MNIYGDESYWKTPGILRLMVGVWVFVYARRDMHTLRKIPCDADCGPPWYTKKDTIYKQWQQASNFKTKSPFYALMSRYWFTERYSKARRIHAQQKTEITEKITGKIDLLGPDVVN